MPYPFQIIPWDTDFIGTFSKAVLRETGNHPENAVIIFMHDRPRRYLIEALRTNCNHPLLLPRILTVTEIFSLFRQSIHPGERREAGRLDQIAILHSCVHNLASSKHDLKLQLSRIDATAFFPWGIRLANIMEECFVQGLIPDDIQHTGNLVAPFGASLLESLGEIFSEYRESLDKKSLTTKGYDAFCVSGYLKLHDESFHMTDGGNGLQLPDFLNGKLLFVAGYGKLTDTEDILFKCLWHKGGRFFLHVDPALGNNLLRKTGKFHWSCSEQAKWIFNWGAETNLVCTPSGKKPAIHFFAGYDLHSQLEALQRDLLLNSVPRKNSTLPDLDKTVPDKATESTTITLVDNSALLPLLHFLPNKECNISLGYPLDQSLLIRLLQTILDVRDNLESHRIYWRNFEELISNPYLRMLAVNGTSLRTLLTKMAERLRGDGNRYVAPRLLCQKVVEELLTNNVINSSEAIALSRSFEQLIVCTVEKWAMANTTENIADALSSVCDLLLPHEDEMPEATNDILSHFPVDSECMFRLLKNVVPALKNNDMARIELEWPLLKTILLQLIREERVPFEADPITGLQVLGMLETRLLHFSNVFMLDVTEDKFPGIPARNPLLPDSLRPVLGLPVLQDQDTLKAYTFFRLLSGADKVWLYWQEGVDDSAIVGEKKHRSRMIEELVWDEEKRIQSRLEPGTNSPLRLADPKLPTPDRELRCIPKTGTIQKKFLHLLRGELSPSLLNDYLRCPLLFFFKRICGLKEANTVLEDDDPQSVGDLLHLVLKEFYSNAIQKHGGIADKENDPELQEKRLQDLFHEMYSSFELNNSDPPVKLVDTLPSESSAMLSITGPGKLASYLKKQPSRTHILALEKKFTATIETDNQTIRKLSGKLDRVDLRESEHIILDYKTGRKETIKASVWEDTFWERISSEQNCCLPTPYDFLEEISEKIPSIQLLVYCYLYWQQTGESNINAGYVELGTDGHEELLFSEKNSFEQREQILTKYVPDLLRYLLIHMERFPEIRAHEGKHCDWCSFKNTCTIPFKPKMADT